LMKGDDICWEWILKKTMVANTYWALTYYMSGTVRNAIHILTTFPHNPMQWVLFIIIPTFIEKLGHRVTKKLPYSHTSSRWQRSQDINPRNLAPESILLTLILNSSLRADVCVLMETIEYEGKKQLQRKRIIIGEYSLSKWGETRT
jgi:hypothetical protein